MEFEASDAVDGHCMIAAEGPHRFTRAVTGRGIRGGRLRGAALGTRTMPYDARAIANLILEEADQQGIALTHMALHKITFFAHGWYLATHGLPLVRQPFEAWQHGPVIRVLFDALKDAGEKPVTKRVCKMDPVTRTTTVVAPALEPSDANFVRHVFRRYGSVHAFELSRLTHLPGTPWERVWNAPGGRVNLGMRIPDGSIRDHFSEQLRPN